MSLPAAPDERATEELARGLARLLRERISAEPGRRDELARRMFAGVYAGFTAHHGLELAPAEPPCEPLVGLGELLRAAPWPQVRPEVFGAVFERALDPGRRHELGAHFTREADILRVVGPTIVAPWQRRISAIDHPDDAPRVLEQLRQYHVLDPACGCGNFLYVAYRELQRIADALARRWTERRGEPPPPGPWFAPTQLHGIERDALAAALARLVLRLGALLHGAQGPPQTADIRHADALAIDWPRPAGELAIVGNPPYLGVRKLRRELGDAEVERMHAAYRHNRAGDYATYWFTRARDYLRTGERAGYVCTNSVAENASRAASIDPILAAGGTITDAWRSYPWPGEAAVHVGIVNWIAGPWPGPRTLDGEPVAAISPALTPSVDVTGARRLACNRDLCFMGVTPGNDRFILDAAQRAEILREDPGSAAVIVPFLNGRDVCREPDQAPTRWIVDLAARSLAEAERYPGALRHVREQVRPIRENNRREARMQQWWQFWRPAGRLRRAIAGRSEVLVIPCVAPHLLVSRQPTGACFDHQLMVVALAEPFHLGVLQSRYHALWARARGSTHEARLRYTNTTVFESFPFPPRTDGPAALAVAAAAVTFEASRAAACSELRLGLTGVHNRLEIAADPPLRAAYEALNDAVTRCYGFPEATWRDDHSALLRLLALNLHTAHT